MKIHNIIIAIVPLFAHNAYSSTDITCDIPDVLKLGADYQSICGNIKCTPDIEPSKYCEVSPEDIVNSSGVYKIRTACASFNIYFSPRGKLVSVDGLSDIRFGVKFNITKENLRKLVPDNEYIDNLYASQNKRVLTQTSISKYGGYFITNDATHISYYDFKDEAEAAIRQITNDKDLMVKTTINGVVPGLTKIQDVCKKISDRHIGFNGYYVFCNDAKLTGLYEISLGGQILSFYLPSDKLHASDNMSGIASRYNIIYSPMGSPSLGAIWYDAKRNELIAYAPYIIRGYYRQAEVWETSQKKNKLQNKRNAKIDDNGFLLK